MGRRPAGDPQMPLPPNSSAARFGPFELDLERQELWRSGLALTVQPQPLRVLSMLISKAGRLVERDEIQKALWGADPMLDADRSLNHTIRKLRQVLQDDPRNPTYIQTVPRRGYRFIAEISPRSAFATGRENRQPTESTESSSVRVRGGTGPDLDWTIDEALDSPAANLRLEIRRFRDISDDRRWPRIADGMTEELVSELVSWREAGLSLVDPDLGHDGGDAAGAHAEIPPRDYRLRGSVRRSGDHVRVNVHLIRCRDAVLVGTATFEADLGNVFELQSRMAKSIADALVRPLLERRASRSSNAAEALDPAR